MLVLDARLLAAALDDGLDARHEGFGPQITFRQVVAHPDAKRPDGRALPSIPGHHDGRNANGVDRIHALLDREARFQSEIVVEDDAIDTFAAHQLDQFVTRSGFMKHELGATRDGGADQVAENGIVVDDHDPERLVDNGVHRWLSAVLAKGSPDIILTRVS